jgi:hypothetical protein
MSHRPTTLSTLRAPSLRMLSGLILIVVILILPL